MNGLQWIDCIAEPDGSIRSRVFVPPESDWFSGHFPEQPILPAIAQLCAVRAVLKRGTGKDVSFSTIKRVRFKQIIQPDDIFEIIIETPNSEKPFLRSFRIMLENQIACNGTITIGENATA